MYPGRVEMGDRGFEQVLDDPTRTFDGATSGRSSILEGGVQAAVSGEFPAVSINLDEHNVPFSQPKPRPVLLEQSPRWDWRDLADRIGRRPVILVFAAAALLMMVFAAFISSNSQSSAGDEQELEAASERSASPREPGDGGSAVEASLEGRSTGAAGEFESVEHYSGRLSEPDEELINEFTWSTTTSAAPTTEPAPPTTTTSLSSTTSTTAQESTTTTILDGLPQVRAISPGSESVESAPLVSVENIVLRAEGDARGLRYRFKVYVWKDGPGGWELDDQSRWRDRDWHRLGTTDYESETIRWTVTALDRDRTESLESAPLYFRIGSEEPDGTMPELANGGFEGVDLGGEPIAVLRDGDVAGWSSSNGVIEFWASGFEGVQAASGSQFIELNSTSASTISQVVDVTPESTLHWSVQHRSRLYPGETIVVMVRPVGGRGAWSDQLSAPLGRWERHDGTYDVPGGVDRVELRIRAVTTGTVGNLVDDVRIQLAD